MAKNIKNILIPINFSESSDCAINTGIAMCKRHHSALHLLQVEKKSVFVYPPGKHAGISGLALEAEVAKLDKLESQARKIQNEHGIDCFYHIASGEFHNEVAEVAGDFYCDLIILEKAASSDIFSFFRRNSSYLILKHVNCPVLTVPTQKKFLNFKKILFTVTPISSELDNLEITLPIIKENRSRVLLFAPPINNKRVADMETIHEFINRTDHSEARGNVQLERDMGITSGSAAVVVEKAIEKKSDLIIITASITKGVKSFFTSNYTEKVMNNPFVPVLSVKLG